MKLFIWLYFAVQVVVFCSSELLGNTSNICGHFEDYDGIILCDQDRRTYIMLGHCMTDNLMAGCLFVDQNASIINRVYYQLPENTSEANENLCKPYHRKGLFCGECVSEFGPTVSFHLLQCHNCSNYSILYPITYYLITQFLPITVLYIAVVLFRINILSSPFLGYVLFCQINSVLLSYNLPLQKSFDHFLDLHYNTATTFYIHAILKIYTFWFFNLHININLPLSHCFSPRSSQIDVALVHCAIPTVKGSYYLHLL